MEMDINKLMEILEHPDQWSRFDCAGANILLKRKGGVISDKEIKAITASREQYLKSQRTIPNQNFALLIILSLFSWIFAFIGGLMVCMLTQTNSQGKNEYVFSEKGRTKGLLIAGAGVISTRGWYLHLNYGG